jgi:hypothetical protein
MELAHTGTNPEGQEVTLSTNIGQVFPRWQ